MHVYKFTFTSNLNNSSILTINQKCLKALHKNVKFEKVSSLTIYIKVSQGR